MTSRKNVCKVRLYVPGTKMYTSVRGNYVGALSSGRCGMHEPTDSLVRLLWRDPVGVGGESSGCQRTQSTPSGKLSVVTHAPCRYVGDITGGISGTRCAFVRRGAGTVVHSEAVRLAMNRRAVKSETEKEHDFLLWLLCQQGD